MQLRHAGDACWRLAARGWLRGRMQLCSRIPCSSCSEGWHARIAQ